MKIHEHQARDLLRQYGIPVPPGQVIDFVEQAAPAYRRITEEAGTDLAVVKAQVHAGGRGKAGFVQLVRTPQEAEAAARFMLTHRMTSPQTPPEGIEVKKLLIAAGVDIAERRSDAATQQRSDAVTQQRSDAAPPSALSSSTPSLRHSVPASLPREEFYLAITTDRRTRRNILIASREGGVDIEHIAATRPEAIIKVPLHPLLGLHPYEARQTAFTLGFTGKQVAQAAQIMLQLARCYTEQDCTLAEINPLVLALPASGKRQTASGNSESSAPAETSSTPSLRHSVPASLPPQVLAIDAKFNFDDNALFRHPNLQALADPAEENPAEARAHRFGLSYIALDGNIGCLVNGAGLAMATMDIIKLEGGDPANFLDVGGSASEEAVTEAFSIILSDPRVKGILVNIFGGIMRCDIIAQGIINAARNYRNPNGSEGFRVPLVVRLEGTNVSAGRKLLEDARRDIPTMRTATDLADAARTVAVAVA
ncbi:MAG: succinate--CoA ligase subunit beta [Phycisphaerales bacterium]